MKHTFLCKGCKKTYSNEYKRNDVCENCDTKKRYNEMLKRDFSTYMRCKTCEEWDDCYKGYCSADCLFKRLHKERPKSNRKILTSEEKKLKKIKEANDKWAKGKDKKAGNGISLERLNRQAEFKRVFDNGGWHHYLSGRKWDRI